MELLTCPFCGCKPTVYVERAPCQSRDHRSRKWGWKSLVQCESRRCKVNPSTGHIIRYIAGHGGYDWIRGHEEELKELEQMVQKVAAKIWNRRIAK